MRPFVYTIDNVGFEVRVDGLIGRSENSPMALKCPGSWAGRACGLHCGLAVLSQICTSPFPIFSPDRLSFSLNPPLYPLLRPFFLVSNQHSFGFKSKLLVLSLPTFPLKIRCPHTCPNRNYPFPSAPYPFSQETPSYLSISFILNSFPPFVFPLSITWFNPLLNQAFCFQITSLFEVKALFFPPLK